MYDVAMSDPSSLGGAPGVVTRPPVGSALAEVRAATAADHAFIDSLIDVDLLVEVEYYAAVMSGLIEAAEIVEATLPRFPSGQWSQGLEPAEVSKRRALDAERAFLNDLAAPRPMGRRFSGAWQFTACPPSECPPSPGTVLGLLYVYVGSGLGGLHMLRVVRSAPWWRPDREHLLLQPYGVHLKDRWRSVLNALECLDQAERVAAVRSARAGFSLHRQALVNSLGQGAA